jgi:hypothetical protein
MLMKYHQGRLARLSLRNAENYSLRFVIVVTGCSSLGFLAFLAFRDIAAILRFLYISCIGDDPRSQTAGALPPMSPAVSKERTVFKDCQSGISHHGP